MWWVTTVASVCRMTRVAACRSRVLSGVVRVCVVGLGKIGLPLAAQYADRGADVVGADIDATLVDVVNAGDCPHQGEPGLAERIRHAHALGSLTATTDTAEAVRLADVVVVVVPLLVDTSGNPRYEALDAATAAITEGLQPGTLVCYETTVPVGTTRTRFLPVLQKAPGLQRDPTFHLCFSPERVYTGRTFADLRKYPKLVGGVDEESTRRGVAFYEQVLEFDDRPDLVRPNGVWPMAAAESAELAKLAETTYRDVNIALANEFAIHCDRSGIDVYEVIAAANSQPFSHIHQPGVNVGGHCIPVYPRLYLTTHPDAQLPVTSRSVNEAMPLYTVDMLERGLGDLEGLTVVILGLAYRGGVKEAAFSGAGPLRDVLVARGAKVIVHDPLYTDAELEAHGFEPAHYGDPCDGAIVQADHAEYSSLHVDSFPGLRFVVDGRNMRLSNLGSVPVVSIGRNGSFS
jgi:UDP-N-acetyl-D-glucosamine dehydrogenase